jgi:arsenite-transporting ATPase
VNVLEEVRRSWGRVQDQLAEFLRREGMSDIQADELSVMPGMDELAALVQIGRQLRTGRFDCIVVDAAPTGETIRLLSTPESFQSYAARIYGWRGRILGLAGPLLRSALPDLNVVDVMSHLAERVKELRTTLTDPARSSYRIVVTPDRMVLKEALRAETYLNIFNYPIDGVILNRMIASEEGGTPFMTALLARQRTIIAEIRGAFSALPIFEAPLLAEEPIGLPALDTFAEGLFGDRDPTEIFHVGPTQRIEATPSGYVLEVPLPNAELDRVSLMKRGDALYIDIGNIRRELTLPPTLAALEPGRARYRQGTLEIPFDRDHV